MGSTSDFCKDVAAYAASLKGCAEKKDLYKGTIIHVDIVKKGLLQKSCYLGNALICMYVKCNALIKAKEVLEELPLRDVVSWSTLISGYNKEGQGEKALSCFEQMVNEGLSPDVITFTCILKACGSIGAIDKGREIHKEIIGSGLLGKDAILGNALIDMYAKCGMLEKAKQVLGELPNRDVVSWNTIMAGFLQQGQGKNAMDCFKHMQSDGLSPDVITFATMLKACASVGAIDEGKQIHKEIVEKGLFVKHNVLGNALVSMYAKFGMLTKAHHLFNELHVRDIVSWNALIDGYAQIGQGEFALMCFEQMQSDGFSPDAITFTCALNTCGNMGSVMKGKQIHDEILLKGLLREDAALGNALMGMYVKCGEFGKAQEVFDELPIRSLVSWSALITGYTEQGQYQEALNQFEQMRNEGFYPDVVSFMCILKTCSGIGALHKGTQIHNEIFSKGLLEKDIELGNALVDMYVKCSQLERARKVFDELLVQDVVAWTALISGYTQEGRGEEAVECFELMLEKGQSPNEVTFLCVLTACSHSGLVEKGQMCFAKMSRNYGITPNRQHYTCMVDLFGHAGFFDKAMTTIKKSSFSHYPMWMALLNACQKWGNYRLAGLAFEQAVYLDKANSAAYVCMTKVFAAMGLQEDAENIQSMRLKNCVV